jgi:hypothetical protein
MPAPSGCLVLLRFHQPPSPTTPFDPLVALVDACRSEGFQLTGTIDDTDGCCVVTREVEAEFSEADRTVLRNLIERSPGIKLGAVTPVLRAERLSNLTSLLSPSPTET